MGHCESVAWIWQSPATRDGTYARPGMKLRAYRVPDAMGLAPAADFNAGIESIFTKRQTVFNGS